MKESKRWRVLAVPALAAALVGAPGFSPAMEEGFYMGLSASAENLDATPSRITDNTHPMNATTSRGRTFSTRDSDTQTISGFGVLAGYTFRPSNRELYLSAEIDLVYHGGKARGRLAWIKDSVLRAGANNVPDWPQSGEGWPDNWTFEKNRSYGLTLRLGGQPDFLTSMLGPDSGLYALAGIRRIEAEYSLSYEGCPTTEGCPGGREDESYVQGSDRTDTDYTAWTAGLGLHTPVGDRLGMQVEMYYTNYEEEDLLLLDDNGPPHIRVVHSPDADGIGLRLRLLRHF
ncbi:MAG: outer membrane beta-barrel protein [Gammaproteobacteria bacterium]|nr:outer membrane beta-barrel protein [Gammaproteobacteria bacterium]MDE0302713.1 outer membrane beta-barrel protein [Gammaproteobacteria bacterium]